MIRQLVELVLIGPLMDVKQPPPTGSEQWQNGWRTGYPPDCGREGGRL